jgi:23S rRNA (adenine2503-C2)-methyltransferase
VNPRKPTITDLSESELKKLVLSLGEPEYRVKQLQGWIFRGLAFSFEEMTNLPAAFRQKLAEAASLHTLDVPRRETSRDGTVKILFTLADGNSIESVMMPSARAGGRETFTVCVSTQAGCAMGCPFCATGQQGFRRNLTSGEIIDQVLYFARYLKDRDSAGKNEASPRLANVVFMGMGEPLANYHNLWQAIEILNSPDGFGLGARNITISTSGLVPEIKRLSREKLQVGLAVSLHAADNALRDWLVPVNRKYPVGELIAACKEYFRATGRRITFEYTLFKGTNDSLVQARALAHLVQGMNCHINLIPANITGSGSFEPPAALEVLAFEKELARLRINATLRQPRGQDISAGCGQLRARSLKNTGKSNNMGKRRDKPGNRTTVIER